MIELLLVGLLVLAVAALRTRRLLTTVIVVSVFSLLCCLVFLLWAAPDVALTEAAVGTGVGSVVFIWIVYQTRGRSAP